MSGLQTAKPVYRENRRTAGYRAVPWECFTPGVNVGILSLSENRSVRYATSGSVSKRYSVISVTRVPRCVHVRVACPRLLSPQMFKNLTRLVATGVDILYLFDRGEGFDHDPPIRFAGEHLSRVSITNRSRRSFGIVAYPFLGTRITPLSSVLLDICVSQLGFVLRRDPSCDSLK